MAGSGAKSLPTRASVLNFDGRRYVPLYRRLCASQCHADAELRESDLRKMLAPAAIRLPPKALYQRQSTEEEHAIGICEEFARARGVADTMAPPVQEQPTLADANPNRAQHDSIIMERSDSKTALTPRNKPNKKSLATYQQHANTGSESKSPKQIWFVLSPTLHAPAPDFSNSTSTATLSTKPTMQTKALPDHKWIELTPRRD
ncbi:hypothetical protein LTR95_001957 [Oleoguttula sp. CCFEE 5521]